MNPLELRDQSGPFETSKNGWIILCGSIFKKLKLHTELAPETVH